MAAKSTIPGRLNLSLLEGKTVAIIGYGSNISPEAEGSGYVCDRGVRGSRSLGKAEGTEKFKYAAEERSLWRSPINDEKQADMYRRHPETRNYGKTIYADVCSWL